MRRGEIWTAAASGEYARKPRPVVIVQDDRFSGTDSVTVCPLTTGTVPAPLIRLPLEPNAGNGLLARCDMMVDKVVTLRRSKLGVRVGVLSKPDLLRLNRAMVVFLGIASR